MSGRVGVEQTPDIEALAVNICSHSGRHTAGDGDHDAEQWGACSQCKHYARVVAPVLAAAEERAWDRGFIARLGDTPRYKSRDEWGNPYRADRIAVDAPEGGA